MKIRSASAVTTQLFRRTRHPRLTLVFVIAATLPSPALAGAFPHSTFGVAGLVEMPSARMQEDGQISAGAAYFSNNQRYNLNFQILPWLETSFRYSGLKHFEPSYPIYWDRSFAVKLRLWDETNGFPAVAVGLNDVVGTGVYGGEYLVASKRVGPVDVSLGMGWGRLGSAADVRNPLSLLSSSFDNRNANTSAGNASNFSTLFHGRNAGLFGGASWETPLPGLTLLTEVSSDAYAFERLQGNFTPRNRVNYGLTYQYNTFIFGLDWLYGKSLGGSLTVVLDPVHPTYPEKPFPPVPSYGSRTPEQQREALNNLMNAQGRRVPTAAVQARSARKEFVDALMEQNGDAQDIAMHGLALRIALPAGSDIARRCADVAHVAQIYEAGFGTIMLESGGKTARCEVGHLIPATLVQAGNGAPLSNAAAVRTFTAHARAQGLTIETVKFEASKALVYYTNGQYFAETEALGRLVRLLTADAPPGIEKFTLIAVVNSIPQRQFDILRAPLERALGQNEDADYLYQSMVTAGSAPMDNPLLDKATSAGYPHFGWGIAPQFRQALFDPSQPIGIQLAADLNASLDIRPGLAILASLEANLYDNFADRSSNSVLPHVRTDFNRYFAQGKTGIANLEGDYRFRLSPDVFAIARAGYLESMFTGAGGEILWRPEGVRWAVGVDAFQVWQRDFNRLFGLQRYNVVTGHVSLYYASPWYDLNFVVRAGQYLAGDRGITFEMTRRFSTGVEIGAFMTKTNVSSQRFGEGSFDKGIIIRMPLQWMLPIYTQNGIGMDIRPVQRDGGQRMTGDAILFDETRRTSLDETLRDQKGFGSP